MHPIILIWSIILFSLGCKTTSARVQDDDLDDPAQAEAVKATVHRWFPEVTAEDPAVAAFAHILQTPGAGSSESPEVFQVLYAARSSGAADSAWDRYVAEQFLALTNYLEIAHHEAQVLTLR